MPSYQFECPRCDHIFEESLMISERDRKDIPCPVCGRKGARRQVTAPSLGSGGDGFGSLGSMPPPT